MKNDGVGGGDTIITLYIEGGGTGNYIQINRFDNVFVRWMKEITLASGETGCFKNVEATIAGFLVRDPTVSIADAYNHHVIVERCITKYFTIR